jgi:hypothetical protein
MRRAALVAGVIARHPLLDVGSSVAVLSTAPQLGVEGVEDVAVEGTDP